MKGVWRKRLLAKSKETQGSSYFSLSDFLQSRRWRAAAPKDEQGETGCENSNPLRTVYLLWRRSLSSRLACGLADFCSWHATIAADYGFEGVGRLGFEPPRHQSEPAFDVARRSDELVLQIQLGLAAIARPAQPVGDRSKGSIGQRGQDRSKGDRSKARSKGSVMTC